MMKGQRMNQFVAPTNFIMCISFALDATESFIVFEMMKSETTINISMMMKLAFWI